VGYWSAFAFLGATAGSAALILGTQVRDRVREARRSSRAEAPSVAVTNVPPPRAG
jgi:hypothetical protein